MNIFSFLYLNQTDPDGTLSWLIDELYRSESVGHSAYILAHIPPGNEECLEGNFNTIYFHLQLYSLLQLGWSRNYYRIINRFLPQLFQIKFIHLWTF